MPVCLRTEIGQERPFRDSQKRTQAATANRRWRANIEKVDPESVYAAGQMARLGTTRHVAVNWRPAVEPLGRIMHRTMVA